MPLPMWSRPHDSATDPGVQASPGQFAQLILYAQERTNVLYVPRGALYQSGGGSNGYVYRVVDGEKVYELRDVWDHDGRLGGDLLGP